MDFSDFTDEMLFEARTGLNDLLGKLIDAGTQDSLSRLLDIAWLQLDKELLRRKVKQLKL